MIITINGQLKTISDKQEFESGSSKKFITVKEIAEYPNTWEIDFMNERQDLLKGFKVGQMVTVKARLTSRPWENTEKQTLSHIMNLNAFEIKEYA